MLKIKNLRSADCVVGGFRYATARKGGRKEVGSLLLGLYNDSGLLDHVGFTSALGGLDRAALTAKLERLKGAGFTGDAPGGPSRWATERSAEWVPLKPKLVVEVQYDHVTGRRFRHGTGFLRWRPDKAPDDCSFEGAGFPRETPGTKRSTIANETCGSPAPHQCLAGPIGCRWRQLVLRRGIPPVPAAEGATGLTPQGGINGTPQRRLSLPQR